MVTEFVIGHRVEEIEWSDSCPHEKVGKMVQLARSVRRSSRRLRKVAELLQKTGPVAVARRMADSSARLVAKSREIMLRAKRVRIMQQE